MKSLIQEYAKDLFISIEFMSFQQYSDSLIRMYGDLDIVKSVIREINVLNQSSSMSAYISEFHRLQVYII